jgi:hypothetical protein
VVLGDRCSCRGSGEGIGKERRRGLETVIGLRLELKGKGRIGGTGVRGITDPIVLVFRIGGISFLIKTRVKIVIKNCSQLKIPIVQFIQLGVVCSFCEDFSDGDKLGPKNICNLV